MGRVTWLNELKSMLDGDDESIGLREQIDVAMAALGASAEDGVTQRKALVDFLQAADIVTAAIVGARTRQPFIRLIAALNDLNDGKVDPLLRPVQRKRIGPGTQKKRGPSTNPSMHVGTMATWVGYADAIAEESGDADAAEQHVASLIGKSPKAFHEQRSHGADYQTGANEAIFRENRRVAKAELTRQAEKRGMSRSDVAALLVPKLLATGSVPRLRSRSRKS